MDSYFYNFVMNENGIYLKVGVGLSVLLTTGYFLGKNLLVSVGRKKVAENEKTGERNEVSTETIEIVKKDFTVQTDIRAAHDEKVVGTVKILQKFKKCQTKKFFGDEKSAQTLENDPNNEERSTQTEKVEKKLRKNYVQTEKTPKTEVKTQTNEIQTEKKLSKKTRNFHIQTNVVGASAKKNVKITKNFFVQTKEIARNETGVQTENFPEKQKKNVSTKNFFVQTKEIAKNEIKVQTEKNVEKENIEIDEAEDVRKKFLEFEEKILEKCVETDVKFVHDKNAHEAIHEMFFVLESEITKYVKNTVKKVRKEVTKRKDITNEVEKFVSSQKVKNFVEISFLVRKGALLRSIYDKISPKFKKLLREEISRNLTVFSKLVFLGCRLRKVDAIGEIFDATKFLTHKKFSGGEKISTVFSPEIVREGVVFKKARVFSVDEIPTENYETETKDEVSEKANRREKTDRDPLNVRSQSFSHGNILKSIKNNLLFEKMKEKEEELDKKQKKLEKLIKIDINRIVREFTHLENFFGNLTSKKFTHAKLPINLRKNRYGDIVPYNDNLVKLKGNDYINCSPISVHGVHYLASQWPLATTESSFWKMVAEKSVRIMVNLQAIKKPSHQSFWPTETSVKKYAKFGEVHTDSMTRNEHFDEYHLTVKKKSRKLLGNKKKKNGMKITLLHFTSWPDKGIPERPAGFKKLIQRVILMQNIIKQSEGVQGDVGPILVNCSAGCGRTGVFMATHSIIFGKKKTQDLETTVFKMREQRVQIVQNVLQYQFCYDILSENEDKLEEIKLVV